MSALTRRTLLGGAVATGLIGATGVAAQAAGVRVTREKHRVVVIGSGFGGGVTALRLTQAGVPVLMLERGIRWPTGPDADTFPSMSSLDQRTLWFQSNPTVFGQPVVLPNYTGLLETVGGENMSAICAAGVGGGSLVYQGMTLQPAENVFNACLPPALDYRLMDRVHYPRVARMLQIAVAPDQLIESKPYLAPRIFARNVTRAGYGLSKIPMPIDWSFALRELRGEMKPAYTTGDVALGVNNGGKHSVDVTYIKQAEATGKLDLRTLHQVTDVARAADGRWVVNVDRLDTTGRVLEKIIITARALVMAAGTMNTTKLLLRASRQGAIRDLPDGVGEGWGSNGDRIYLWTNTVEDFGLTQGGPVIYGSKEWGTAATANTIIQASPPPLGVDIRSTMMVGFGVSSGRGRFVYDSTTDKAVLQWPKDGDAALYRRIGERASAIAGPGSVLLDTNAALNTTWHPLGGACMGTVCDLEGRVLGQTGLYVLDGALIPGSTAACNPSMTIAAVAERALDRIVAKDVGTLI